MATQHPSSALQSPALPTTYPMANPGYGKRSAPHQHPRTTQDFALLPVRERYVAGFVDHLPEGAAMSVKQLAKQVPLYGQQAISSALTALSVAGHLRRVRCPVSAGDETRWVSRTFWSRTARDNEWWTTYLTAQAAGPEPEATTPPPPWVPDEEPPPQTSNTEPEPPATNTAPAAPRTPEAGPSPAYLALARLGRNDHRLALSADDCAALEAQAAEWLARGVSVDHLTSALTAGLPAEIGYPAGLIRRRLTDKMPPHLPTENTTPNTPAPAHRVLMECTDCGRPGKPEALPDGLCRPCRTTHNQTSAETPDPPKATEPPTSRPT